MKKTKVLNVIFKYLFLMSFITFLTIYLSQATGYYEYRQYKKKELTEEQIIEGDTKVFKIVSYIGILWILGLFCGSKNDSKVRFHVGQGIILTIACVAAGIVAGIINLIIVATCVEASFFGITTGVNTLGKVLLAIVNLAYYGACIFYIVTGIVHAAKDKEEKLPLIGNLAFYK